MAAVTSCENTLYMEGLIFGILRYTMMNVYICIHPIQNETNADKIIKHFMICYTLLDVRTCLTHTLVVMI